MRMAANWDMTPSTRHQSRFGGWVIVALPAVPICARARHRANTAIFGVVHAVMLSLRFPQRDHVRLYQVYRERDVFSPPNFLDVQKHSGARSAAALDGGGFLISGQSEHHVGESHRIVLTYR
jgi:hypothetical protein